MKALIVLLIGLLLLGAAAFGGWTLYKEYVVAKEAPAEPPPPPKPGTAYVRVQGLTVPMFDDKRVRQFVSVVATLQVDEDKQAAIQGILPRIQSAMLTALYDLSGQNKLLTGNLVNIAGVKTALFDAAKTAIGGDGLQDMLIQVVTQRNL